MNSKHPTMNDGIAHIKRNILQELYKNVGDRYPISAGIINHAKPATNKFPKVQNAAMNDSIEPLLDLG